MGILFRNFPFINRNLFIHDAIGTFLRKFAFVIILLRAGLGLDGKALMELKVRNYLQKLIKSLNIFRVLVYYWHFYRVLLKLSRWHLHHGSFLKLIFHSDFFWGKFFLWQKLKI